MTDSFSFFETGKLYTYLNDKDYLVQIMRRTTGSASQWKYMDSGAVFMYLSMEKDALNNLPIAKILIGDKIWFIDWHSTPHASRHFKRAL